VCNILEWIKAAEAFDGEEKQAQAEEEVSEASAMIT